MTPHARVSGTSAAGVERGSLPPGPGRKPTLLVVDDETGVRSYVARMMANWGWSVIAVDSVASAVLVARNTDLQAALCDVVMPGATGLEFVRQMREVAPELPVLLMSGHPTPELFLDEPMPRWWAPVALIEKPFTGADLCAALGHLTTQQS
jgi:DNA-binding NtrC family response regulator